MTAVQVRHALGTYPVHVEPGILARLSPLAADYLPGRRLALIADQTVFDLHRAGRLGASTWEGESVTFPPGERSKTRESWGRITDELLAMLDASVGGKTGVDTAEGKNLIGAFHPPAAVLADPLTLLTLPDREFRAGLAEAVKHGIIADRDYFEWIDREADRLLARDGEALRRLVQRSVEIKAEVVGQDEREGGRRATLNAGHTVAHALERATDYRMPHGEAVGLGLVAEAALAADLGHAPRSLAPRIAALLERLGLPVRLPEPVPAEAVIAAMKSDKKNRRGAVRFALPRHMGDMGPGPDWTTPAGEPAIRSALGHIA